MKIFQLIPQLASGGAERFVVDLANEQSRDHEVVLVVSLPLQGGTAFYLPEVSERVKVYSLNKRLGKDFGYLWRLLRLLKQLKPDVVHTHISSFTHFAVLKMFFPKVCFVHTVHSEAQREAEGGVSALLRKIFFRQGWAHPVTIGVGSNESFRAYYGVDAPIIANGRTVNKELASGEELIPPYEGLNLVSIGHISKVKNHLLMCRAVAQLAAKGTKIQLYMFGRSVDSSLEEEIRALQSPNIHLLGEVQNPAAYLRNADVFCMSSIMEGLPISLIEAMSCGLIPVCTAVGSIPDMVTDGENGFFASGMELEQYVEALRRCVALSADERALMKVRNIERTRPYAMDVCAEKYMKIYGQYVK